MKEVIIFSNINQFALLRQLAKYGVNTMGYRVFNNSSILSYIREKTGNLSSKTVINSKEKTYLYNKFLNEDQSYFKGASYESAKGLVEAIDSIRTIIVDDEEKEIENKLKGNNKYEAIKKFYKEYLNFLKTNNKTDLIQEIREIINLNFKIDMDVLIIKGEELSPLYRKLLETCFKSIEEIEYQDLYNVKHTPTNFKNLYVSNGYSHEIANVFKIIVDNELPIDKCTIVYTDYNNFYNPIKEYSELLSLPVTYINGIPALENSVYRFIYLLIKLNDGLYGYDVLMNLLKDKSFNLKLFTNYIGIRDNDDRFFELVGDLKFTFDSNVNDSIYSRYIASNNDYKEEIEKYKNIFNKGIINLFDEYLIGYETKVKHKVIEDLILYRSINNKDDFDFLESYISKKIDVSFAKPGTLSVCSISKAKENIRENMFFVGNDSDSFHISLAENSFIADDKLKEFNKEYAKTSIYKANKKISDYKDVIQIAFDLGSNIYVSYSLKDEIELKDHNLISLLYDMQKSVESVITFDDFKNRFEPVSSYYGNNLQPDEKIIETYLDKTNVLQETPVVEDQEPPIVGLEKNKYSPTKIEQNLNCKKRFFIEHILKIDPEDIYDVFEKLDNTDLGNMFHKAMQFVNEGKNEKEVKEEAERIFESVRAKRNPLLDYELEKDKEQFIKMVVNGFYYLMKKKKGIAEKKLDQDLNIKGNVLHIVGTPDLVSGNEIIDYKAKRNITHKDEDTLSCIQALIYALMNSKSNIDHVEYYYPLFKRIIKTTYNENNVVELLDQFYQSISSGDFIAATDELDVKKDKNKLEEICSFCQFGDICGRNK